MEKAFANKLNKICIFKLMTQIQYLLYFKVLFITYLALYFIFHLAERKKNLELGN